MIIISKFLSEGDVLSFAATNSFFSFFFMVGVLRVSYILETKFTIIIHVCMCQRYSVIPIFKFFEMEVSAAYPTPKLKINNWEIVKVQDIVS